MFFTNSGIKRTFYCQTGNFQFGADILLDNYVGSLNFGISGSGAADPININFLLSGGKIIDQNGKFLTTYSTNNSVQISGNVTSGFYDIFVNQTPILYGNSKPTGIYNYFYLNPQNVNCAYNFYVNGADPNLLVTNVEFFTGATGAAGQIINESILPLRIYSGGLSNFSSNSQISLSGLFTGDLYNVENFYIIPNGQGSLGNYSGNLQLTTNAGILNYPLQIIITGTSGAAGQILNLNGLNVISAGQNQSYTANIVTTSGAGYNLAVSLSYVTGSGDFYETISVSNFYTGGVTGFILNNGFLTQFVTGSGSGFGGELNNLATGLTSGFINGNLQYSTGTFTWPYNLFISGYGTGNNYSGIGTGFYNYIFTGTILTGSGTYYQDGPTLVNQNNIQAVGPTGYIHGTGAIYYNAPANFDKLYVANNSVAILNNFSYFGITGLVNYLNNNTGIHLVTAITDNINTVTLSGIYGINTDVSLLVDNSNVGNMAVSGPMLLGGMDLGIGNNLISVGNLTGCINNVFTGSGNYSQAASGTLTGFGNVLNYTKTFTGSWDLLTGRPFFQADYFQNNFYNSVATIYQNNYPTFYSNSTAFINVIYTNIWDSNPDVALLTVSGVNTNLVQNILITGN